MARPPGGAPRAGSLALTVSEAAGISARPVNTARTIRRGLTATYLVTAAVIVAAVAPLAADPALSEVRFLNSSTAAEEEGGTVGFSASASLVKRQEAP